MQPVGDAPVLEGRRHHQLAEHELLFGRPGEAEGDTDEPVTGPGGYQVESRTRALLDQEVLEAIRGVEGIAGQILVRFGVERHQAVVDRVNARLVEALQTYLAGH